MILLASTYQAFLETNLFTSSLFEKEWSGLRNTDFDKGNWKSKVEVSGTLVQREGPLLLDVWQTRDRHMSQRGRR